MTKKADKYFKVISKEGETSADIYLYGFIGQTFWDRDRKEEEITDIAFVHTLKDLESKHQIINIHINSPGGMMYHGNAIITAMQTSKAKIHTWNDGLAASMAADIFLAGDVRHMAKNALLMIHSPSTIAYGTAKDMRKEAEVLDKFEQTAIAVMVDMLGQGTTEEEIKQKYYDYEDHWFTAKEAIEEGLVTKLEEDAETELPEQLQSMTYAQIVQHFTAKDNEEGKGLMQRVKETIFGRRTKMVKASPITNNEEEMNIENIQKALESGEITKEELADLLTPKKQETVAPELAAFQDTLKSIQDELKAQKAAREALETTVAEQEAIIKKMDGTPSAEASKTHTPTDQTVTDGTGGDDDDDFWKEVRAVNKQYQDGGYVSVTD